jgi:hypothetical protein
LPWLWDVGIEAFIGFIGSAFLGFLAMLSYVWDYITGMGGDGPAVPPWIPFVVGVVITSVVPYAYAFLSRLSAERRNSSERVTTREGVLLLARRMMQVVYLKEQVTHVVKKQYPDMEDLTAYFVARACVMQTISTIMAKNVKFRKSIEDIQYIPREAFNNLQELIDKKKATFMSYRKDLDYNWFDDEKLLDAVEDRLGKYSESECEEMVKYWAETYLKELHLDDRELTTYPGWLKGAMSVISGFCNVVGHAVEFVAQIVSYTLDVAKAMKNKACPVIFFKDGNDA